MTPLSGNPGIQLPRLNRVVFPSHRVWLSEPKVVVPSPIQAKDRTLPNQVIIVPPKGENEQALASSVDTYSLVDINFDPVQVNIAI